MRTTALMLLVTACASAPPPISLRSGPVDLTLRDLSGHDLRLADLRGRVVLIDFFASWCEPCRDSLPYAAELERRYGDALAIVAVSLDTSRAALGRFLADLEAPQRIVHDPSARSAEIFDVQAMPTLLVLDRGGNVRHRHESFRPADRAPIERTIRALIAPPR